MDATVRATLCPCCLNLLFALELSSQEGWRLTKESPPMQNDNDGPFMKCPRCSRRIALFRNSEKGEAPFQVAANQKCDRILK